MLIVFAGLPGTGKTTVARAVAAALNATFLRIDDVEQAILSAMAVAEIGAAGYGVVNRLAEANLVLNGRVIVDCVNPVQESRQSWRIIAARTSARLLEVEVVCFDQAEHRRRVEQRRPEIPGHVLPTWEAISRLVYEPWTTPHLVLDTAYLSPQQAVDLVVRASAELP